MERAQRSSRRRVPRRRPHPRPGREIAKEIDLSWRKHGGSQVVGLRPRHRDVVGRGGCSRVPVDADWVRLYAFLPDEAWASESHLERTPAPVHANWVEVGWALRRPCWGQGYATEIGNAGLEFAFTNLGVRAVVSCAARETLIKSGDGATRHASRRPSRR
ncbi:MAG: GNAT family N-acetyltransferase [Acidimicrobiales bacterium]